MDSLQEGLDNSDEESETIAQQQPLSKKQKIEANSPQDEIILPSEFKMDTIPFTILSDILKYYVDGYKLIPYWTTQTLAKETQSLFETTAKKWYPGIKLTNGPSYYNYLKQRVEYDFRHSTLCIPYFMEKYNKAFHLSIGKVYSSLNNRKADLESLSSLWSELNVLQTMHEIRSKRIEVFVKEGTFPSSANIDVSNKDEQFLNYWWSYNIYFNKYDFQEDKEIVEETNVEETIIKWSCTLDMFTPSKLEPLNIRIEIERRSTDAEDSTSTGSIKLYCSSLSDNELFSIDIEEEDQDEEEEEENEEDTFELDDKRVAELLKYMCCSNMNSINFLRILVTNVIEDNEDLQEFVEVAFDKAEGDAADEEDL